MKQQIDAARIAVFCISEEEAQRIVDRLSPGESLLGATCGKGFRIETAEEVAVVNEVLAPGHHIWFKPDRHTWSLQTFPEVVDAE